MLLISGGNDVVAEKLDISLNAMTWAGRIGMLLVPPLAYYVTYRICLGLQQHDREVLAHGVETGIIRRLPDGRFIEVHQPLAPADDARPRRAGVRRLRRPEEDEPPRRDRARRPRLLLPDREAGHPGAAAGGHAGLARPTGPSELEERRRAADTDPPDRRRLPGTGAVSSSR